MGAFGALGVVLTAVACIGPAEDEPERVAHVEEIGPPALKESINRITGLSETRDGRIVLLDAGNGVLIRLGLQGRTFDTLAGPGSGPGELGSNTRGWMARGPGDSTTVTDIGNGRVVVFADDGSGFRSITPTHGISGGQAWIPVASGFISIRNRGAWKGVVHHAADGRALDTLLTIPWSEPSFGTPSEPLMHIFGEDLVWAYDGDRQIAISINTKPTVTILDVVSGTTTELDLRIEPTEVTKVDRDALVRLWNERAALSDVPPSMARRIRVVVPTHFPLIPSLAFAGRDGLLIQGPPDTSSLSVYDLTEDLLWGTGGRRWLLVDRYGTIDGAIVFAHRFRPLHRLSDGRLLGVLADPTHGALPGTARLPRDLEG
jgi:hypothetical protein